MGLKQNS